MRAGQCAVLFGVVLLAVACGGKAKPDTASPTGVGATPGQAVATEAPAEVISGVTVRPVSLNQPVPLPEDLALYVSTGCLNCDAAPVGLDRIYRDASGSIRRDTLFQVPGATRNQPEPGGKYLISARADRAATRWLSAVCEGPYMCGSESIQLGSHFTIHESLDGGVTWKLRIDLDGGGTIVDNLGAGRGVLVRTYQPPGGAWRTDAVEFPSLQVIDLRRADPTRGIMLLPTANGPTLFRDDDGVTLWTLSGGSQPFLSPKLPPGSSVNGAEVTAKGVVLTWTGPREGTKWPAYIGLFDPTTGIPLAIFRWTDEVGFFAWRGATLNDYTLLLNVNIAGQGVSPARLDIGSGQVSPIRELMPAAGNADRSIIEAAAAGPFARVKDAGDCLNVRDTPPPSGRVLGCFADGVLFRERGESRDVEGSTWIFVTTPEGVPGWASNAFLETTRFSRPATAHPPGTRTGNRAVDGVLAAIEAGDPASLLSVTRFTPLPCRTEPGLGVRPLCPPGVATGGQDVEVFVAMYCEGDGIPRAEFERNPVLAPPEARLYAVYRRTGPDTPPLPAGKYVAMYVGRMPSVDYAWMVTIDGDGKAVSTGTGCARPPELVIAEVPPSAFLLPPLNWKGR